MCLLSYSSVHGLNGNKCIKNLLSLNEEKSPRFSKPFLKKIYILEMNKKLFSEDYQGSGNPEL